MSNSNVQRFNSHQHMVSHSFEIYHYCDAYLNEVALHHHDFYEIYYFMNGSVNYIIEGRTYNLSPGDLLLISPSELHQPLFLAEKPSTSALYCGSTSSFWSSTTPTRSA